MKIGLTNIYSFRPHVEHLYYLSLLLRQAGHEVAYLTCDSSVATCYPRILKNTGRARECSKCMLGGVRSYPARDITSLSSSPRGSSLPHDVLQQLAHSSAATLTRTESAQDYHLPEVAKIRAELEEPINQAYQAAMAWIERKQLDAVICFNGRMDLTRGITFACEKAGIPFLTHERTWFGDGLRLIPNENCLSVRALSELAREFDNRPLTSRQARIAGKLIGDRFLQRNSLEWRLYNRNPLPAEWPLPDAGARVLVLPSSKNEFAGHPEWVSDWADNTHALDDFFDAFGIGPRQVVLRCHPNWGEAIGKVTGERSKAHYYKWASDRGIHCIRSEDKASTYDLIQQADIVVMNGGSSAVEAGACGKQVFCLGPASYQAAGFLKTIMTREDLALPEFHEPLDREDVLRKTLRYVYLRYGRFAQYVEYVRAESTTKYAYYRGADPDRLLSMMQSNRIYADDPVFADSLDDETEVVSMLNDKNWAALAAYVNQRPDLEPLYVGRRKGLRWIDDFRAKLPRGDRS
ncbi:capsule biosynthesis protein [Allopusillimonas soli]|uniref:Capsule biosynthesis protein n=1 Tax=Allopusillimonas soli TaxID=659016 RepID=A0A853FB88_9BURK|nr:capsule biosynthesis protein [Allopusillimonas soli]NYT38024.1 capsule biosynthesis protein [Allopusillimonas soli]TEA73916.1 capsule biosynthesis protein [Allopusillimonas soli]